MNLSRRFFLKNGALALAGTAALPAFLTRAVLAATAPLQTQGKRLVVIFQRGAADGLNIVVPYREPNYYQLRSTIAIPQNQVLDLDGFFGLHPAMASLQPLYKQGHLAIVHAAGSPDSTRSHFDAQDYMESGTPGLKSTRDGWLNRALQAQDLNPLNHTHSQAQSAFRAIALGPDVPRTLSGKIESLAISNVQDFALRDAYLTGHSPKPPTPASSAFEAMYGTSTDQLLHSAGDSTFEAIKMLRATDPAHYKPAPSANYPTTPFAKNMQQVAQLLKGNLGVEAAFTDIGGWDTHVNQGSSEGQLANRLRDFADSIAAFWRDMGDDSENITLVTMSEFGRTAHQNGTGGTDHGHANAMFVLGGQVKGGKVYGKWPGLADHQLNEGRDLTITTDYRNVLGELVTKTLNARNLDLTFPNAKLNPRQFLSLV